MKLTGSLKLAPYLVKDQVSFCGFFGDGAPIALKNFAFFSKN